MSVTNGLVEIEDIEPTEILDYINSPDKKGKYITYRLAEDRWVALDKMAKELRTALFAKKQDAIDFLLNHGPEAAPVVVDEVTIFDPKTATVPVEAPQTEEAQPKKATVFLCTEDQINARLLELRQYGLKFDYKEKALIYRDAENVFYFPSVDIQCDSEEVWAGKMETLRSKLKPVAAAVAVTVPAEPAWMDEALQNGSGEPEGGEYAIVVPDSSKADELLRLAQNVTRIEGEYFNKLRTFNDLEAELKRLMNDFDLANAELINNKKAASAAKLQAENDLKQALCEWGSRSAEKTFDQYLSVMETSSYEIDEAEATTWAQTNYPAALNTVLNQKLIIDYIKKSKKFLSFVKVTKQVAAKISRKV
jgi:hypothetical protein